MRIESILQARLAGRGRGVRTGGEGKEDASLGDWGRREKTEAWEGAAEGGGRGQERAGRRRGGGGGRSKLQCVSDARVRGQNEHSQRRIRGDKVWRLEGESGGRGGREDRGGFRRGWCLDAVYFAGRGIRCACDCSPKGPDSAATSTYAGYSSKRNRSNDQRVSLLDAASVYVRLPTGLQVLQVPSQGARYSSFTRRRSCLLSRSQGTDHRTHTTQKYNVLPQSTTSDFARRA